jgi:Epoxide hydrolase N terminus
MLTSGARPADPGAAEGTEVRPFHIDVPEEELADLRRRIEATRWPETETVDDFSQGVQLAFMQALAWMCTLARATIDGQPEVLDVLVVR